MDKKSTPGKIRDLIYILAPSYTGSTLLTFLLSKHRDISTIGELKATARGDLDTYLCSCGLLQKECSFWKRVTEEMLKTGYPFALDDFGTHFQAETFLCDRLLRAGIRTDFLEAIRNLILGSLPCCKGRLHNILERNRQIIDIICELQQGEIFLDGSKDPIRLKLLSLANYWNLKVIYLIRDGRGATNSYMRHYDVPMEKAAQEWCQVHHECDRIIQKLRDDEHITIHYEDLCGNSEGTMTKIYDFLGLSANLDELQFKSSEHHIMGNPMRLKSTREIKLDEKWKNALTQDDLKEFRQIAGKFNHLYGYE